MRFLSGRTSLSFLEGLCVIHKTFDVLGCGFMSDIDYFVFDAKTSVLSPALRKSHKTVSFKIASAVGFDISHLFLNHREDGRAFPDKIHVFVLLVLPVGKYAVRSDKLRNT